MNDKDDLTLLIQALKKREQILINGESVKKYNRYFDSMRKYARDLIENRRQAELLPYLECDSISIQRDVAGLLYHCYPEKCEEVLKKIASLSVETGLPMCFVNVSLSAEMALEVGIPKEFP